MHVRITKVRRGTKTYRYVQLVQSVRRPNGTPGHEVIASFKYESDLQVENLRTLIIAQREGRALAVDGVGHKFPVRPVAANRRYLDLAVLRRMWRDAGLQDILRATLPLGGEDVADADIIEALVLHRCAAPGSKLAAVRWFCETALPEMTGIQVTQFNNSRVHRSLEALERSEAALQERLPIHLRPEDGQFVALFMDGTDTWFEGVGPELAAKGRTKDGAFRQKIGIILLCDARGLPLRWKTLSGKESEIHGMTDIWKQLGACSWVGEAPIVADRAMGSASVVEQLVAAGPRFLVAVREPEFRSWVPGLKGLSIDVVDRSAVLQHLREQGFERVDDRTWFLDVGVAEPVEALDGAEGRGEQGATLADAIRLAQQMSAAGGSMRSKARQFACSMGHVSRHLALLKLSAEVVERVLAGEGATLSLRDLVAVANAGDAERQHEAFDGAVRRPASRKQRPRNPSPHAALKSPMRVRRVVYFNPDMFADQRAGALASLADLEAWIATFNARISATPARYSPRKVRALVDRELARRSVVGLFDVAVAEDGAPLVALVRDESEWQRRRSLDGHSMLLAHPDLPDTPPDLIRLYRQRNQVEVDFRTIKSVLELRPVHHHTDIKVRAHVAICVLALLLSRLTEARLAAVGLELTLPALIEKLSTCHLNELVTSHRGEITHTTTRPNADQERILRLLRMRQLVDDDAVRATLNPR